MPGPPIILTNEELITNGEIVLSEEIERLQNEIARLKKQCDKMHTAINGAEGWRWKYCEAIAQNKKLASDLEVWQRAAQLARGLFR